MNRSEIKKIVFESVSENLDQGNDNNSDPKVNLDTPIYGQVGLFDSLGLVNLLVSIEQKFEDQINNIQKSFFRYGPIVKH